MRFSSLWSGNYWRQARDALKQPRLLAVSALLLAASIAIASVFIPLPANLRVYFSFLPKALCGAVCGPVCGVLFGAAADLLGYMLHPSGGFFFGYTLSSMTGMLLYGLGLFRARLTPRRLAITKLAVNLLCNVGLGALWSAMLYQKGYLFYLGTSRVPENAAACIWFVRSAVSQRSAFYSCRGGASPRCRRQQSGWRSYPYSGRGRHGCRWCLL